MSMSSHSQETTISLNGHELTLKGSLVYSTVSGLLLQSRSLLKKVMPDSITINLSGVEKIDSAGIALLVEWQRYCQQYHKQCRFSGLNEQAISLIETYKLTRILRASE